MLRSHFVGYCWWKKSGKPADMVKIPLFTGYDTSQVVVWDFFHQQCTCSASKTYQIYNNTVPNQMSKLENNHPQMAAVCFTQKKGGKLHCTTGPHTPPQKKKTSKTLPRKKNKKTFPKEMCSQLEGAKEINFKTNRSLSNNCLVQKEINFIHFQFPAVQPLGPPDMVFARFLVTAPHDQLHVSGWDSWLSSCPNLAPKGWGYKESSNTCNMFAYWDNVYMLYIYICWNTFKKMDKKVDLIWGKWPSMYCHYLYIYICLCICICIYIYIYIYIYMEPVCSYLWASTLKKKTLSNQNKGQLGSRYICISIYIYYYIYRYTHTQLPNLLIGGKCLLFLFSNLNLHARRKIHGRNFRDAISHWAEYVNTS